MYRATTAIVCCAALLTGCETQKTAAPATRMPTLRRIQVRALDSLGPELTGLMSMNGAVVSVSSHGVLAFTQGFNTSDRLITLVDTTGRLLGRIGKKGGGPGEFGQSPSAISLTDTSVLAFDMSRFGFVELRLDGTEIFRGGPIMAGLPASFVGDSVDFLAIDFARAASSGRAPPPTRVERHSTHSTFMPGGRGATQMHVLVDSTNAQFQSIVARDSVAVRSFIFASNLARFAVASPNTKQLALFASDGRVVATADSVGLLTHLQVDDRNRVWGLASPPPQSPNDSTTITLYDGADRLGSQNVRCPSVVSVSVRLPFLAMLCKVPSTQTDKEIETLVFRIEEPPN